MFLERVFHKLMLNFTWWVNRKDSSGKNLFEGGFLGLDNIGVFDRRCARACLLVFVRVLLSTSSTAAGTHTC